jgi:hypothetical protein
MNPSPPDPRPVDTTATSLDEVLDAAAHRTSPRVCPKLLRLDFATDEAAEPGDVFGALAELLLDLAQTGERVSVSDNVSRSADEEATIR